MTSQPVRILNFDNSVVAQHRFIDRFQPAIVDLTDIGPSARVWMSKKTAAKIRGALRPEMRGAVTFLGSGDFHHVTKLLVDQFEEPLSVIVFDHHPDWYSIPPWLGCGSWVTHVLKNKNVEKVVILGVASRDISTGWIQGANLSCLEDNRLEIYPYAHSTTGVVFRRVPENISVRIKKRGPYTELFWEELKGRDFSSFLRSMVSRLPTRRVYVSIDKDCLNTAYALTNWEEGHFDLDEVCALLSLIMRECDVVGCDITGDYSPLKVGGMVRSLYAWLDHPRRFSARMKTGNIISTVNEATNIELVTLLARRSGPARPHYLFYHTPQHGVEILRFEESACEADEKI
jgi:arginase family enzyme